MLIFCLNFGMKFTKWDWINRVDWKAGNVDVHFYVAVRAFKS